VGVSAGVPIPGGSAFDRSGAAPPRTGPGPWGADPPRATRVAHLVSHPIQYYVPLYRELAARRELDLTVYYYSGASLGGYRDPGFGRTVAWDTPLLGGYRARLCPSAERAAAGASWGARPNWDVVHEVARGRYDVVWLHGYNHPTSLLAAAAARASGARLLIRDDQTLLDRRPWWKRVAKRLLLAPLFSQAAGLYVGEQSRRHFAHYGMPAGRLYPAPHCVDNRWLGERAAALDGERRRARARFGVQDDAPVILYCGKLIDKKQPLTLLDAYAWLRRARPCWLLIAGDGPLRPAIEARIRDRALPGVRLAGFLNQSELPEAYTAADLLALPSGWQETWGLVVNEAMNFALPIVASDRVGCAADLVRSGWNGFVVPSGDVLRLAESMGILVADAALRRRFGEHSRSLVEAYTVERCADGIVAACTRAGAPAGRAA